jgi:hypothetical protein
MPLLLVFHILAVLPEFQEIIPGFTITVFEAIVIFCSIGGFNDMGEKAEIVTQCKQSVFMNF